MDDPLHHVLSLTLDRILQVSKFCNVGYVFRIRPSLPYLLFLPILFWSVFPAQCPPSVVSRILRVIGAGCSTSRTSYSAAFSWLRAILGGHRWTGDFIGSAGLPASLQGSSWPKSRVGDAAGSSLWVFLIIDIFCLKNFFNTIYLVSDVDNFRDHFMDDTEFATIESMRERRCLILFLLSRFSNWCSFGRQFQGGDRLQGDTFYRCGCVTCHSQVYHSSSAAPHWS